MQPGDLCFVDLKLDLDLDLKLDLAKERKLPCVHRV